jgi:hypothetical protein
MTEIRMAASLTPEDRARVLRGLAEMERRALEDDYGPDPQPDAWRDSIAPGVRRVSPPAASDDEERARVTVIEIASDLSPEERIQALHRLADEELRKVGDDGATTEVPPSEGQDRD